MKKILIFPIILICLWSCDKTIDTVEISPLEAASNDDAAGTWKTYILKKPDEILIAAPTAITSKEYLAELANMKIIMAAVTPEEKKSIDYWSAGAVYRWNEIARELAAKYNLPPKANESGQYPIPNPLLPNELPKFPFANPPYTARALAYLNVAQYDALVAAWHYKQKYKRPAPYTVDNSITPYLAKNSLTSYPSEDAVVAAASYEILVAMFPGEVDYLKSKAEQAGFARNFAGMNTQSDLLAGAFLGSSVAKKVLEVAKTDGMADANKQTFIAEQKETARKLGVTKQWESLELPARPPMLPNYGNVKTWNLDKTNLIAIRPILNNVPESDGWNKELQELKDIGKKLTREQSALANFWSDGQGSYTPPGHWNRIAAKDCKEANFSEVKTARSMALMHTAIMDAGIACWYTKYYYNMPRPQQFGVKTPIGLPNFPSFVSGHSAFSAAAAGVLGGVFPSRSGEYGDLANKASDSRIYGQIHFRSDCEAGLELGKKISVFALKRGEKDGSGL